jgi:hypothetical protein
MYVTSAILNDFEKSKLNRNAWFIYVCINYINVLKNFKKLIFGT